MSTGGPSLVLTPVAGRRRGRVTFAVWLAVLIAVVTWVLAAGIGSAPRDGRAAAVPGGGAASPSSRPPPSGPIELLEGKPPTGTAWLRAGNGARSLDLATGVSKVTRTAEWRDRILAVPGGAFLCVCHDITAIDGGERVAVSISDIVGNTLSGETELITVEGRREKRRAVVGTTPDTESIPVATSASLSPDGTLLVVGLAVRRPPSWERSLLVVHLPSREVLQRIDFDPALAGERVEAWAPRVQFSQDGLRALVSLTVIGANQVTDERHFVAWIHGQFLDLDPVPGFGTNGAMADGRCIDTIPELVGRDTVFGICHNANWEPTFLRSVELKTGRAMELDLGPVVEGSWPMRLVDGTTLFLWDPFSHRVARINLPSAKLDAAAVIQTPTAALKPLDRFARSLSAWIAPTAMAKIMLEPAVALSADGRRLYVVAMSGDGIADPGRPSTIHVLDAGSLVVRDTWTVEPDIASIAIAPNGRDVIVGMLGEAPELVAPPASVMVLDADTGMPRALYQGLGTDWPMLIERSDLNQ
jgi:hypothetical protein